MEPLLPRRCNWLLKGCRELLVLLPMDETLPRRTMRFVWMSPTGVGEAAWVRRAAAAAELERVESPCCFFTKARAAADAAEGVAA